MQNGHDLTVWRLNLDYVDCDEVVGSLGWSAWRFNPDIAYLVSVWIISSHEYMGGREFWRPTVSRGDGLLRFVRNL